MPLSEQSLSFSPTTSAPDVFIPVGGRASYVEAIAAGGLVVSDVLSGEELVRDPSNITHSSRRILTRPIYAGTTLRIRLVYGTGDAVDPNVSPLVIRVFGAHTDDEWWTTLRNVNGDASVMIPINPASDTLATSQTTVDHDYTISQPDNNAHSWDSDGCDRFLIGIEKVYTPATGGNPSLAYLQAKIV